MARQVIPVGDYVECDLCGTVLTNDPRSGGFMFRSNGVGPCCCNNVEASARHYHEEHFIGARCPEGKSFADWIRQDIRGGKPAVIEILTGDDIWR